MLQTTSLMDCDSGSLFGSPSILPFSSCAMQEHLIHPFGNGSSAVEDDHSSFSFGWSDFPVVYQHSDNSSSSGMDYNCYNHHHHATYLHPQKTEPSQSSPPELEFDSHDTQPSSPQQARREHRKQVSWGSALEIRTHSVILGDHPCCRDSLPLQLGWEYNDSELVNIDLYELHKERSFCYYPNMSYYSQQQQQRHKRGSNSKPPPRLTYMERKNLLKHVGGMTEHDLALASGFKHVQHRSTTQLCAMDV
jgi:hypothetical protein